MGKAKDGSECFTKTNKSGGKYVTCKGTQGKSKAPVKATDKQKELMRKRRAEAKAKKAKPPQVRSKVYPVSTTKSPDNPTFNVKNTNVAEVTGPKLPQRTSTTGGTGVITGPNGGVDRFAPIVPAKPAQDIGQFLDVMNVIGQRNKQRISESIRPKLEQYSIAQLKKAIKKDYEEKNPGRTVTMKGSDKERMINHFIKNKVNVKFLPAKGREEPKNEYIIEGFNILDDETGELDGFYSNAGFSVYAVYPSGLTRLTGKLTKGQANTLAKEMKTWSGDGGPSVRFYRETPKSRIHFWEDPL